MGLVIILKGMRRKSLQRLKDAEFAAGFMDINGEGDDGAESNYEEEEEGHIELGILRVPLKPQRL
jgi:hypothetical protein